MLKAPSVTFAFAKTPTWPAFPYTTTEAAALSLGINVPEKVIGGFVSCAMLVNVRLTTKR